MNINTVFQEFSDPVMSEVWNLDHKRVCDISLDAKIAEIRKKDCVTRIEANPDGTLLITNTRELAM